MSPSGVLSRPSPCDVPQGYASVAELPAALLGCHFEHPAWRSDYRLVTNDCSQSRARVRHLAEPPDFMNSSSGTG
jgi:hypothetical protein